MRSSCNRSRSKVIQLAKYCYAFASHLAIRLKINLIQLHVSKKQKKRVELYKGSTKET
jgi:hypothetical protein